MRDVLSVVQFKQILPSWEHIKMQKLATLISQRSGVETLGKNKEKVWYHYE